MLANVVQGSASFTEATTRPRGLRKFKLLCWKCYQLRDRLNVTWSPIKDLCKTPHTNKVKKSTFIPVQWGEQSDTDVPFLLLHLNLTRISFLDWDVSPAASNKPSVLNMVSDMLSRAHTRMLCCLLTGPATRVARKQSACFSPCTCLVSLQVSDQEECTSARSPCAPPAAPHPTSNNDLLGNSLLRGGFSVHCIPHWVWTHWPGWNPFLINCNENMFSVLVEIPDVCDLTHDEPAGWIC